MRGGDGWEFRIDDLQDIWLGNPEFYHTLMMWHCERGWPFSGLWAPLRTVPEDHEQENASYVDPRYTGLPELYRPCQWRSFGDAWEDFNFEFSRAYDADTLPYGPAGGGYSGELASCFAVTGTSLTAPYLELMKVHCIMLQRRGSTWVSLAPPDQLGPVDPIAAVPDLPQDVDPQSLSRRTLEDIPAHMRLAIGDAQAGQARQSTPGQATLEQFRAIAEFFRAMAELPAEAVALLTATPEQIARNRSIEGQRDGRNSSSMLRGSLATARSGLPWDYFVDARFVPMEVELTMLGAYAEPAPLAIRGPGSSASSGQAPAAARLQNP